MKKRIADLVFVVFVLITLLESYSVYKNNIALEGVVKPLVVVSLTIFYLLSAKKINKWYLIALFFSSLGDILLLNLKFFLLGTTCFLVVHLIYVKITLSYIGKISTGKAFLPLFFFLAFLTLIIWLIKDGIESFIVLIICYGTTICSFAGLAFYNNLEKPNKANTVLFFASFVFVLTNTLIAMNRFYSLGNFGKGFSMIGYSLAQCLVCFSVLKIPVPKNEFGKKTTVLSVFFLLAILGLFAITSKNYQIIFVIIPLVFLLLIVIYVLSVKKVNLYFLGYSILVLISETLLLFKEKLFLWVLVSSIFAQLILIYLIVNQKIVKFKQVLVYFLITFFSYHVLYSHVMHIEEHFLHVVFGAINALLTALALDNYIKKMRMPNYLLWLGVSFGVLDIIIIALDVKNTHLNVYSYVVNIISHYLICRSFVILENRHRKKIG